MKKYFALITILLICIPSHAQIYTVERVIYEKTETDESLVSPNDIVAIGDKKYYFTNDHGYTSKLGLIAENYLGLKVSNVVYFNGAAFKEVAGGIAYANGINYDQKRNLLFVASPRGFQVNVYATEENGNLSFVESIPTGTSVILLLILSSGFFKIKSIISKQGPPNLDTLSYL